MSDTLSIFAGLFTQPKRVLLFSNCIRLFNPLLSADITTPYYDLTAPLPKHHLLTLETSPIDDPSPPTQPPCLHAPPSNTPYSKDPHHTQDTSHFHPQDK